MKKRLLRSSAILVIFAAITLTSCEFIEDCGTCEFITEVDGVITEVGTPLPFCGEALTERQSEAPVTVGNTTTYWNCY